MCRCGGAFPTPRAGHTAVSINESFVCVYGGGDAQKTLNDGFVLRPGGRKVDFGESLEDVPKYPKIDNQQKKNEQYEESVRNQHSQINNQEQEQENQRCEDMVKDHYSHESHKYSHDTKDEEYQRPKSRTPGLLYVPHLN